MDKCFAGPFSVPYYYQRNQFVKHLDLQVNAYGEG